MPLKLGEVDICYVYVFSKKVKEKLLKTRKFKIRENKFEFAIQPHSGCFQGYMMAQESHISPTMGLMSMQESLLHQYWDNELNKENSIKKIDYANAIRHLVFRDGIIVKKILIIRMM